MNHQVTYSQPSVQQAASSQRYASTSSAFSASANPNEDWTKISDLAERRRIQNRIAQRNYRKKLKRRLEELERRAASNSLSPEPRAEELAKPNGAERRCNLPSPELSVDDYSRFGSKTPEPDPSQSLSEYHERSMFFQQSTRQLSTSPPLFACSKYPSEISDLPLFSQTMPYSTLSSSCSDMPWSPSPYLPPVSVSMSMTGSSSDYPFEQRSFIDSKSTYDLNYSSLGDNDVTSAQSYTDSEFHVIQPLNPSFPRF